MSDHRAKIGEAPGRGDNAAAFIFLRAALWRPFLLARSVRFLAPAVPRKIKTAPAKIDKRNLPK
jgi:hypothetical protein